MGKIIERILSNTEKLKTKEAYFYFENDEKRILTYGDFRKLLFSFCQLISEFDVNPGDLILLVGENSPRWPAAYLGAHMLGLTVVHADGRFSQLEFTTITRFVAPKLILCGEGFDQYFDSQVPKLILEDVHPNSSKTGDDPSIIELSSDQPMSIIFTSGTTGEPKGVMLSEANYLSNLKIFEEQKQILTESDRMLGLLPSHHVYPFLTSVLAPPYFGASLIYPKSLSGEDIFGALREFDGTMMVAIPKVLELFSSKVFERALEAGVLKSTIFKALFAISSFFGHFGINLGKGLFGAIHKNFPHFRFFGCGGAKLDAQVFKRLKGLGFKVIEAYGLTETSPIAAMNSYYNPVAGSVGNAALDVMIKIEKENDQMDHGEICIKGPNVMMGYYKRPDLTAEVIKDGWFHSGDLGYLDKKGRVFITGRKKEVIILSNGKNIYPDELEMIYSKSVLINELCITLVKGGSKEFLTAVVVPNTEEFVKRKRLNYYEEIKFELEKISQELASYQRITKIEILSEELPRTALGKLRRFKVDEMVKKKSQVRREETAKVKGPKEVDPVCQFIKQVVKLDKMPKLEDNLEIDLGLDSLSKIELFSAIEQKYGIALAEEEKISILTVSDILAHIKGEFNGEFKNESTPSDSYLARQVTNPPVVPLGKHVAIGNSPLQTAVRFVLHLIVKLAVRLFFKVEVEGALHLKKIKAPYVIAPNHNSLIDGFIIYALLPFSVLNRCFWMSLPEYFAVFPYSLIRKVARVILTGTTDTTMASLQYAYQTLESGGIMCVFPEGRRSADGFLNPPKFGIGVVATESNSMLLPVYIEGADKVLSLPNPGFRPARIKVQFLPPIDSSNDPEKLLAMWKDTLSDKIKSAN